MELENNFFILTELYKTLKPYVLYYFTLSKGLIV